LPERPEGELLMPPDIFEFLTESDRKLLFDGARRQSYQRGQFLFKEGARQPDLYVLRRGLVRVERAYQGHGLAVARYGPGDVVGEVAFLDQEPAHGSVVAEEDVEVDILEGQQIQAKLASDSGFASRFYHSLARCLGARLLQIMPGLQLPEALAAAGAHPPLQRTGQLSERQFPPELTGAVETFRAALRALMVDFREGRLDPRAAQERVNHSCDALLQALNRFTQDDSLVEIGMDDLLTLRDVPDLARGVGGYVFRECFALFMQSAAIAQAYEKPRGYPEDRDLLERIERNEPEGDGRLGPMIDRWFLERPLCRSRRNSVRHVTAFLQEVAAAAGGPGPVRLASLAAGTAQEVFALLAATSKPLYVTCLDSDADALATDAERARLHGCSDRITFLQADLLPLIGGQTRISLGLQQAIYGLGVCDYLKDEQIAVMLKWAYDHLAAGGWLLLTNRDAASPDRAFAEHVLDWPVVHRTTEDLSALVAGSPFGSAALTIGREEAEVNLIARCRKG
jgi:extracellular factor (EF) 3-hydroxypalmitic acid methyl ester biosynthesis protein